MTSRCPMGIFKFLSLSGVTGGNSPVSRLAVFLPVRLRCAAIHMDFAIRIFDTRACRCSCRQPGHRDGWLQSRAIARNSVKCAIGPRTNDADFSTLRKSAWLAMRPGAPMMPRPDASNRTIINRGRPSASGSMPIRATATRKKSLPRVESSPLKIFPCVKPNSRSRSSGVSTGGRRSRLLSMFGACSGNRLDDRVAKCLALVVQSAVPKFVWRVLHKARRAYACPEARRSGR